jgi:two-component system, chemotaxis family, response regulator Rcp1
MFREAIMRNDTIGRPMEILMVEDSLMFARITMGALKEGAVKHRMTWLTDGFDALEFLHRRGRFKRAPRPDLLLLDLGLPKIDGREVLTEVKSDDGLRTIPVVVMTGSEDVEDRLLGERLQVEGYVTKPVDFEKFLRLVAELREHWQEDMVLPC